MVLNQCRYKNSSLLISDHAMSIQSSRLFTTTDLSEGLDGGPKLPSGPGLATWFDLTASVFELWTADCGLRTVDCGLPTVDCGL